MDDISVWEGIIVGGVGGMAVNVGSWIAEQVRFHFHKNRLYTWLSNNTSDENNKRYRSTRAIASWNNLTEDRVRYVCSHEDRIYLSTGDNEDMWGIHDRGKVA